MRCSALSGKIDIFNIYSSRSISSILLPRFRNALPALERQALALVHLFMAAVVGIGTTMLYTYLRPHGYYPHNNDYLRLHGTLTPTDAEIILPTRTVLRRRSSMQHRSPSPDPILFKSRPIESFTIRCFFFFFAFMPKRCKLQAT